MLSFSFKKLINFSTTLFVALVLFILFFTNAQAQQNCETIQNKGSNEYLNCIADSNNQRDVVPKAPSIMAESECSLIKDKGSNEYLTCIADLNDANYAYNANIYDDAVNKNTTNKEGSISCSSYSDFFKNFGACFARGLGYVFLKILTYLVSFAGQIFDLAVKFSLFEMGILIGQANSGINIAWGTIRDLGNILFIFMLLWVSIKNILQIDDAKKFIPTLILAALLVNFSLFFTKVIIDTSNIVAVQFYSSITKDLPAGTGISGAFMEKWDAETMFTGKEAGGTAWGVTVQLWATAALVFVMFFIFLQASFLFIVRTAVLIFLLPFSPIMFLGTILPRLKKFTDKWWEELICNSLSAPIYFLLIWVSLQILSSISVAKPGKGINDALTGLGGYGTSMTESTGIIFNYLLVCVFLIASYRMAKCDGISGTITSGLMTVAGAAVGGIGGYAGRRIIGGLAAKATDSEWLKSKGDSKWGRLALRTTEGVAKSSFDIRAAGETPLVGGMASKLAETAGVKLDLGKKPENLKDGYRGDVKRGEEALGKERAEMAKLLEAKKVGLTEEEKAIAKKVAAQKSFESVQLTEEEKAGKDAKAQLALRLEKFKSAKPANEEAEIKTMEADKQRTTTQERQKGYFDQLKSKGWGGEVVPQIFKTGSEGGTKKAEKEIDQKYKADREIAQLEETIKELMGNHGSVKEAIDNFTKQAAIIGVELEDLGKGADKDKRAKLILEKEMAKTNARTLQNYINKLDLIKDRESKKKDDGGSEKKK